MTVEDLYTAASGGMAEDAGAGLETRLQELVLDSPDVAEFLNQLAGLASARLSKSGNTVLCGITTIRRKRPVAAASSDSCARALDELQNGFGDGPCLTALRQQTTVHVPDIARERRWSDYLQAVAQQDIGSILAVPLVMADDADAVINLYSRHAHGFSGPDIIAAESFGVQASLALRLALRIAQLREARDDLSAAMQSRTTIDMAIGAIMAQNRCSRDSAFKVLRSASSHRNIKIRDVAASVIASISGETDLAAHFIE